MSHHPALGTSNLSQFGPGQHLMPHDAPLVPKSWDSHLSGRKESGYRVLCCFCRHWAVELWGTRLPKWAGFINPLLLPTTTTHHAMGLLRILRKLSGSSDLPLHPEMTLFPLTHLFYMPTASQTTTTVQVWMTAPHNSPFPDLRNFTSARQLPADCGGLSWLNRGCCSDRQDRYEVSHANNCILGGNQL